MYFILPKKFFLILKMFKVLDFSSSCSSFLFSCIASCWIFRRSQLKINILSLDVIMHLSRNFKNKLFSILRSKKGLILNLVS